MAEPKKVFMALLVFSMIAWSFSPDEPQKVTAPPNSVVQSLNLDPFYTKYVDAKGLAVVASTKVSDYALLEAAYLIEQMLWERDDILKALAKNEVRFVVMAHDEFTTMIPEHSDLEPSKFWDRRARGLGATPVRPAVSCGEENLLCYPGDPYHQENILIHEFAHAIHHMGLNTVDKAFDPALEKCYQRAMKKELWKGKYAANNRAEYWAEGVQSWFDTNREDDHDHNHVDTREELKAYDPDLAALIQNVFGDRGWRYRRPPDRKAPAHLMGYDGAKAPTFSWPSGLLEWYRKYQEEQEQKKGTTKRVRSRS